MANELIKYRVCDKCTNDTVAVETHKLTLNGYRYEIDLCDKHAKALQAVVESWTMTAALVGEPSVFDRPRTIGGTTALQNLPGRAPKAAAPEQPAASGGPAVRDYADNWFLTDHAKLRMQQRQISLAEALQTAEFPEQVVPSTREEGYYVHRRGDVKVVVHGARIITVTRADNEEMEMASGS